MIDPTPHSGLRPRFGMTVILFTIPAKKIVILSEARKQAKEICHSERSEETEIKAS
jgi:hypothetical protein